MDGGCGFAARVGGRGAASCEGKGMCGMVPPAGAAGGRDVRTGGSGRWPHHVVWTPFPGRFPTGGRVCDRLACRVSALRGAGPHAKERTRARIRDYLTKGMPVFRARLITHTYVREIRRARETGIPLRRKGNPPGAKGAHGHMDAQPFFDAWTGGAALLRGWEGGVPRPARGRVCVEW